MSQTTIVETTPLLNRNKTTETFLRRSNKLTFHKTLFEPQIIFTIKNGSKRIMLFHSTDREIKSGEYLYMTCKPNPNSNFSNYKDLPMAYDNLKCKVIRVTLYKGFIDCYNSENIQRLYPWVNSIEEAIEYTKIWYKKPIGDPIQIRAVEFVMF